MSTPDPQPELPALARPRELVVDGNDLVGTLARLQEAGATVERMDANGASYTLHIFWPPCSCEICCPVLPVETPA